LKKAEMEIASTAEVLNRMAAAHITGYLNTVLSNRQNAFVALSGGSTPRGLFQVLVQDFRTGLDWNRIRYFWSDERHVPYDDPDHNGRMAADFLLSPLRVKSENIFMVDTACEPLLAAQKYEKTICEQTGCGEGQIPAFDLILLGLGQDGHTASLFPGTTALEEKTHLVAANWVETKKSWRITFTFPLINHAAQVLFLVSGRSKAEAVCKIIELDEKLPASYVESVKGDTRWFLDSPAASLLSHS
jgi:6-phosphogluconolactonase